VSRNCVDIATDKIGCFVIPKCLCLVGGSTIDMLDTRIISNAMDLVEN
jgi:hypothetical protein